MTFQQKRKAMISIRHSNNDYDCQEKSYCSRPFSGDTFDSFMLEMAHYPSIYIDVSRQSWPCVRECAASFMLNVGAN